MTPRFLSALALLCALLLTAATAHADTLTLKNGNSFEGKVVRETATHVYFKIRGMGEQPFAKSKIKKIERGESVFDDYTKRRKALASDDADGHYELGNWCRERGLRKEAKKEFQAAVEADPDHAGAREELGFVHYEFEWVTKKRYAEIMKEIEERESGIIAAFTLGDAYKDDEAAFQIGTPKVGFKTEKEPGLAVTFTGPELGKFAVTFRLELIPDASTLADSVDEYVKGWAETLEKRYEAFEKIGAPSPAKLGGLDGRLLATRYTRDDVAPETLALERRDLVAKTEKGYLRLSMVCRAGYAAKLWAFFGQLAGSTKVVGATDQPSPGATDVAALDRSYTLTMPDDTYQEQPGNGMNLGPKVRLQFPPNTQAVGCETNQGVVILVREGRKDEGSVDCASLQTIRDAVPVFFRGIKGLLFVGGQERTLKVGGADALAGDLKLGPQGQMGGGRWCVFLKGERFYQCLFLNFVNSMGEQYVTADFQKLLDGFKFK